MDCPHCHGALFRSQDSDAAGDCLNCGSIYVPIVTDPRAELALERASRGTRRDRAGNSFQHFSVGSIRDGCAVSPSCLSCPLPECHYVSFACELCGAAFIRADARERHRLACELRSQIKQARANGETTDQVAARFGVARRTVFRIAR